jgi:hypothetical protein
MGRKLAGWALLAFVIFYAITDPTGAAHGAHQLMTGLAALAHGVTAFITALSTTKG